MLNDKRWSEKYSQHQFLTLWGLAGAFCNHYAICMYLVFSSLSLFVLVASGSKVLVLLVAILLTATFYPLVEYLLHRYVLHSRLLYKNPVTAPIWRRLHYDHHMNPNNLSVLFASPFTSIPLLVILAAIPSLALDLHGLFPAMLATNFLMFTYYEFMHTSAHLKLGFQNYWIARHKKAHLRHHFVSETHFFGIGTHIVDKIVGTDGTPLRNSSTVRNLGYDDEVAAAYPWVRDGYRRDYGSD